MSKEKNEDRALGRSVAMRLAADAYEVATVQAEHYRTQLDRARKELSAAETELTSLVGAAEKDVVVVTTNGKALLVSSVSIEEVEVIGRP